MQTESSKMNDPDKDVFHIDTMRCNELDPFIDVYSLAFEQPLADMVMPMIYPEGLMDPQVHARLRKNFNDGDVYIVARHTTTGKLLGVSWWQKVTKPLQTPEEINDAFQKGWERKEKAPIVPGMRLDLERAYYEASFLSTLQVTKSKPYWELRILAIHPDHQKRGIGSALLRDGLERVIRDQNSLPVFVISARQGKRLYESFGFHVVQELPLDARDYGGWSQSKHWCMIRPGQTARHDSHETPTLEGSTPIADALRKAPE